MPGNLIITHNNKPTHICKQENSIFHKMIKLDDNGNETNACLDINDRILTYFKSFESKDFIKIYYCNDHFQIEFIRYGIVLVLQEEQETHHWFYTNPKKWVFRLQNNLAYKVIEDEYTTQCALLPNLDGVLALILENENTKQRQCYIPIQPFVPMLPKQQSLSSEFYKLQHDSENQFIKSIIVEKYNDYNQIDIHPVTYINYLFDATGKLLPQNNYAALYLCYIYLSNHRPKQAWNILEDCRQRFGGLQGTFEEIVILQMIIDYLPAIFNKKYNPSTPPYVACRLKALSMFLRALTPDKKIIFPQTDYNEDLPYEYYQNHYYKNLNKFYTELNHQVFILYDRYQKMTDDLTYNYVLTKHEKLDLLSHYFHNN